MKDLFIDMMNKTPKEAPNDIEAELFAQAVAFETHIYSAEENNEGEKLRTTIDLRDYSMITSIGNGDYTSLGNGVSQSIIIASKYEDVKYLWEFSRAYV